MDKIKKAYEFAKVAHGNQERKFVGIPYTTHIEETVQLLWEVTKGQTSTDNYIAAILHDVVEDTNITLQEIDQHFGRNVANLVDELTIDEAEKEAKGKKQYLSEKINGMSRDALSIKLCDRLSNIVGLDNKKIPKDFVKWYIKETQYIIDNIDRELTAIHLNLITKIRSMMAFLKLNREL